MLDMSERENRLSWLFFFRDFFLAERTGKEWVQIISYSTHSAGIEKSLKNGARKSSRLDRKDKDRHGVYVGVEGKDSKYKEGHCSVWEV